ncbi:unnamed protein product [Gadus morhua 'NCC']
MGETGEDEEQKGEPRAGGPALGRGGPERPRLRGRTRGRNTRCSQAAAAASTTRWTGDRCVWRTLTQRGLAPGRYVSLSSCAPETTRSSLCKQGVPCRGD